MTNDDFDRLITASGYETEAETLRATTTLDARENDSNTRRFAAQKYEAALVRSPQL